MLLKARRKKELSLYFKPGDLLIVNNSLHDGLHIKEIYYLIKGFI